VLSGQGLTGPILLPGHYEDLVFDRLGQRHPAENLSGHYARQRNHVASPPARSWPGSRGGNINSVA